MTTTGGVERIRVLIADDHALFRRGLELVLQAESDIDVVGEAGDGIEAVDRATELAPDVVLMDVRMPGASGIEAARRIRSVHANVKIVAVALVAGMMVIGVGIAARSSLDLGTDVGGNPRLEDKGPVIKATKPTAFSGGETITVR